MSFVLAAASTPIISGLVNDSIPSWLKWCSVYQIEFHLFCTSNTFQDAGKRKRPTGMHWSYPRGLLAGMNLAKKQSSRKVTGFVSNFALPATWLKGEATDQRRRRLKIPMAIYCPGMAEPVISWKGKPREHLMEGWQMESIISWDLLTVPQTMIGICALVWQTIDWPGMHWLCSMLQFTKRNQPTTHASIQIRWRGQHGFC